jgi:hypothetical protein
MAKVSRESAPNVTDYGPAEDRGAQLDGYAVILTSIREDWDLTPLLKGLPGDSCQCPHWAMSRRGASPSGTATAKRSSSRATRSTCHQGMFPQRWRERSS